MGPVTLYGCALPHHVADLSVMIGPGYVDRESGTRAAKRLCGYGFKNWDCFAFS